jgi:hypothetical protein
VESTRIVLTHLIFLSPETLERVAHFLVSHKRKVLIFLNEATGGRFPSRHRSRAQISAGNGANFGWSIIGPSSTAYAIVGVGDFNGDGTFDPLFGASRQPGCRACTPLSHRPGWLRFFALIQCGSLARVAPKQHSKETLVIFFPSIFGGCDEEINGCDLSSRRDYDSRIGS